MVYGGIMFDIDKVYATMTETEHGEVNKELEEI